MIHFFYNNLKRIYLTGVFICFLFVITQSYGVLDVSNIVITFLFFLIVFSLFMATYRLISKGLELKESLQKAENKIADYYNDKEIVLDKILKVENFFNNKYLDKAFDTFKNDYYSMKTEIAEAESDIEKYINYELIESIINTHFLNLISGTMTGLGILGTFLGLSIGLNSFKLTGSADAITKDIQPLMSGIKVAFHTSIYGLIYSILFNFYYREKLKGFSEAISSFINTWQKYVVPVSKNGNEGSLIKYQKRINDCLNRQIESNTDFYNNTNNSLRVYHNENINKYDKQIEQQAKIISLQEHQNEATDSMSQQMAEQVTKMMEAVIIPEIKLMREAVVKFAEAAQEDQIKAMQKIVEAFLNGMEKNMGQTFHNLRETLNETNEWQKRNIEFTKEMMESMGNTAVGMDNINKHIDSAAANVAKYAEAVEQMQNSVNSNLMSLNVQAESSRELIESQKELIDKIIETENSAKNNFSAIIEKVDKQTEALNDFNSKIEQKIKDEFSAFANNIDNVTSTIISKNTESIKFISDQAVNSINEVSKVTIDNQKEIQNKYNEISNTLKISNNQMLEEINRTSKEYIEKLKEITSNSQNIISNSYNEFTSTLKETNKQSLETITNTSNECISKISSSSHETQIMLSNGFSQIATSITNTISSLQEKLIAVSEKMDNQLETLTDINNNLKQELKNEVDSFAKELNQLTSTIVTDCKKALESLSQSSINCVDKLENITIETQTQLQEKFNRMETIIRSKLEKVGEINGRLIDDISSAATNLGNAAKNLDNGLTGRIKETFATFDRELAELLQHFSGTLKHMDSTLGNTQYSFDSLSQDIDVKFEKIQEHLDQYLEYTDKLHHNLEFKWNQLKNE